MNKTRFVCVDTGEVSHVPGNDRWLPIIEDAPREPGRLWVRFAAPASNGWTDRPHRRHPRRHQHRAAIRAAAGQGGGRLRSRVGMMPIETYEMFRVICDHCGTGLEARDSFTDALFYGPDDAEEAAKAQGWDVGSDQLRALCPECAKDDA